MIRYKRYQQLKQSDGKLKRTLLWAPKKIAREEDDMGKCELLCTKCTNTGNRKNVMQIKPERETSDPLEKPSITATYPTSIYIALDSILAKTFLPVLERPFRDIEVFCGTHKLCHKQKFHAYICAKRQVTRVRCELHNRLKLFSARRSCSLCCEVGSRVPGAIFRCARKPHQRLLR